MGVSHYAPLGAPERRRAALSPSRAKDFKQCPLLFRLRMVDRLDEPGALATHRGTLVHAVLERLYDLPAGERTVSAALGMLRRGMNVFALRDMMGHADLSTTQKSLVLTLDDLRKAHVESSLVNEVAPRRHRVRKV